MMFVIVEWNQASHRPRLYCIDVFDDRGEAQEVADRAAEQVAKVGRRERFTVHELDDEEDER